MTLKLVHLLLGLAALAFGRLVISGHFSPTNGKYFEEQEVKKHKENSCALQQSPTQSDVNHFLTASAVALQTLSAS